MGDIVNGGRGMGDNDKGDMGPEADAAMILKTILQEFSQVNRSQSLSFYVSAL